MSDDSIAVSLGDFAALLAREVAQALAASQYYADYLDVRSVRIRLGQLPEPGGSGDVKPGVVLAERYPFLDRGWELELEMDTQVRARKAGEPLGVEVQSRDCLALFGDHDVSVVKGVSGEWAERLGRSGITSVRALAEMSDKKLMEVIRSCNSRYPRELRGKARLLQTPLPVVSSAVPGGTTLFELLSMAEDQLRQLIGPEKISSMEAADLAAVLDILAISVDVGVLRRTTLAALLVK